MSRESIGDPLYSHGDDYNHLRIPEPAATLPHVYQTLFFLPGLWIERFEQQKVALLSPTFSILPVTAEQLQDCVSSVDLSPWMFVFFCVLRPSGMCVLRLESCLPMEDQNTAS
jgi:hypothetical protein